MSLTQWWEAAISIKHNADENSPLGKAVVCIVEGRKERTLLNLPKLKKTNNVFLNWLRNFSSKCLLLMSPPRLQSSDFTLVNKSASVVCTTLWKDSRHGSSKHTYMKCWDQAPCKQAFREEWWPRQSQALSGALNPHTVVIQVKDSQPSASPVLSHKTNYFWSHLVCVLECVSVDICVCMHVHVCIKCL